MARFSTRSRSFDPYRNFRFTLKMGGTTVAGFAKAGGLDGPPSGFGSGYGVSLERGVTHDSGFERWAAAIWQAGDDSGAGRLLVVERHDEAGAVRRAWRLEGCRVRECQTIADLDASANAVAIARLWLLPDSIEEVPVKDSAQIDAIIAGLGDWRGPVLAQLRGWILQADPDIAEEIKWRKPSNPAGVPCWSRAGLICTGETYKDKVKLTFAHGASLEDPAGIFNASLTAGTRRAIDIAEGQAIDAEAFKELVRAAVAYNLEKPPSR